MVYTVTLANSIIGVGILAMPFCFQKCGLILAILLLVISNLITRLCCYYLLKSSAICRRRSMEIIAFSIFGSSGKLMVELCVIGYLLGSCITYFVVVGDLGPQIIAKIFDLNHTNTLRLYVMIFVTIACIIPLGLLRNVDSLAAVCTASIGFYFCLVLKVIHTALNTGKKYPPIFLAKLLRERRMNVSEFQWIGEKNWRIMAESTERISIGDWMDKVEYWNWSGVMQCLPILTMALSCQMQLFEVFENVSNISLDKMNEYVKSATTLCTFVYILVGVFGYVAFSGKPFSGNILLSLSPSLASDAIKIGFVLSVAFSFPLIIFPCRASLYSLLYRRGHADVAHYIPEHRFKLITISLVLLALFIGILIPSIELIIGFIGSTIGVAICIMFPASCFIKVCKKNSNEKLLAQFLLIFGFILMVLGTYANLNAIDEKSSGSFEESESILKHVDDSMEQLPLNLSKQHIDSPEMQVEHVIPKDVTPYKLGTDLEILPDRFETLPKSPDLKVAETKYHENPVDGLHPVEQPKESSIPKASDTVVKLIPLDVENEEKQPTKPDGLKKSIDINNEAIQKEEQEIAIEKKEQSADDSQNELKRLEETKKLLQEVKEIKNVLEKQNQETQQLVLQKFDEIVDKVEKIEKVQEEDNKKHEEEKAEKKLAVENVADNVPLEESNVAVDKNANIRPAVATNQTINGPIISAFKHVNQVEPTPNSQETNLDNKSKLSKGSKEGEDHVPIQRDLLNVQVKDETTDQSAIDKNVAEGKSLRHKRDAAAPNEDCTKATLNDESESMISENELDLDVKFIGSGRDLKSAQDN